MAKRKAGVKDIIYELDNEDLSGSSDDDLRSLKTKIRKQIVEKLTDQVKSLSSKNENENSHALLAVDKANRHLKNISHNGGKSDRNSCKNSSRYRAMIECESSKNGSIKNESHIEHDTTIIFDKDIETDSPTSNNDYCVLGSENKAPLIRLKFRDKKVAKKYKHKIKTFILDIIKINENEDSTVDSDTDIELNIWPEDYDKKEKEIQPAFDDNLFFVDTDPCSDNTDVPMYKQALKLISNTQEEDKKSEIQAMRPRFLCFNCDGEHQLKDCKEPRNHARIAEKRRNLGVKLGRYHVEDEQKYGHLIPGRISGQLRHALGIKRYELPLHIYRMRLLGYPCGWMEEAKILPSGINMFDSSGNRILDPGEEDGEVFEPGSRDLYDIKKIYDFPGFNVPASSMYIEESHLYGLPPLSEKDSKNLMLQRLAPNAMMAYKRKKLTLFPSSANNSQEGQAEMELDSDDETPVFPSVPPLPDEEPPKLQAPPPPPPGAPPSPQLPDQTTFAAEKLRTHELSDTETSEHTPGTSRCCDSLTTKEKDNLNNSSTDDIEIVEAIQIPNITVSEDDLITIEDDETSILSSGKNSPTIDDLEAKKLQLLDAIKSSDYAIDSGTDTDISKDIIFEDKSQSIADESIDSIAECILLESDGEENKISIKEFGKTTDELQPLSDEEPTPKIIEEASTAESSTSIVKTGKVKDTLFGTPVINIASPFNKLPSDEKFAKDICDIIYYENLPNSIGKYKKICSLLKKVKSEVDRIQES